jgi:hypothetical protein
MAIAFTKQIQAGNGDCTYQKSASGYIASEQTIWLSSSTTPSNCRCGGFYFPNITIPKGQTIVSAYLEIYTDFSTNYNSGYEPVNVVIYGDDRDTSEDFNYINVQTPGSRTHTTASINWTITDYIDEEDYTIRTSPDIKTVIQEIIDRDGWASNNSISLLVESATESGLHSFYLVSYDNEPSLSAKLVINYNPRVTDTRSATIRGKASDNSSRSAKVSGIINTTRFAKLQGKLSTNSTRNSVITGKPFTSDRLATLTGKALTNSTRDSIIRGKLATNDSRNAKLLGQIKDDRNAILEGIQDWYQPAWKYRKKIVIDHTKVAANQTNFPVLISLTTDNQLRDYAQSDGDDILFTNYDSDAKLPHEIETYVSASGKLIAWVNVDNLSSTEDTVIYMYYGNTTATSQQNKEGTWESNFKGVWHMTDVTTSTIDDSTSNNNDGTKQSANNPIQIDGQIYKAQDFDGATSGDKIELPTASASLQPANLTFEAWIYRDTDWSAIGKELFYAKTEDTWDSNGWYLAIDGATPKGITLVVSGGNGVYTTETNPNNLFANNAWTHLVITWNSITNTAICKINNVAKTMTTAINTPDVITGNTTSKKRIGGGANAWTTSYINAGVDEMRIHATDRDANWLTTNYNTQSSPSTFSSIGSRRS